MQLPGLLVRWNIYRAIFENSCLEISCAGTAILVTRLALCSKRRREDGGTMGNERVASRPDSYSPRGSSCEKWIATAGRASLNFHADEILNIFTRTPRPPFDVNQIPRFPVSRWIINARKRCGESIDRSDDSDCISSTPATIAIMLELDSLTVFQARREIFMDSYSRYSDE